MYGYFIDFPILYGYYFIIEKKFPMSCQWILWNKEDCEAFYAQKYKKLTCDFPNFWLIYIFCRCANTYSNLVPRGNDSRNELEIHV